MGNESRYISTDEQSRELTRSISHEVAKLSEQWNKLIDHSDNWKHSLDEYMTVRFIVRNLFLSILKLHFDDTLNQQRWCQDL